MKLVNVEKKLDLNREITVTLSIAEVITILAVVGSGTGASYREAYDMVSDIAPEAQEVMKLLATTNDPTDHLYNGAKDVLQQEGIIV